MKKILFCPTKTRQVSRAASEPPQTTTSTNPYEPPPLFYHHPFQFPAARWRSVSFCHNLPPPAFLTEYRSLAACLCSTSPQPQYRFSSIALHLQFHRRSFAFLPHLHPRAHSLRAATIFLLPIQYLSPPPCTAHSSSPSASSVTLTVSAT